MHTKSTRQVQPESELDLPCILNEHLNHQFNVTENKSLFSLQKKPLSTLSIHLWSKTWFSKIKVLSFENR